MDKKGMIISAIGILVVVMIIVYAFVDVKESKKEIPLSAITGSYNLENVDTNLTPTSISFDFDELKYYYYPVSDKNESQGNYQGNFESISERRYKITSGELQGLEVYMEDHNTLMITNDEGDENNPAMDNDIMIIFKRVSTVPTIKGN